jgi:hypothetical protein
VTDAVGVLGASRSSTPLQTITKAVTAPATSASASRGTARASGPRLTCAGIDAGALSGPVGLVDAGITATVGGAAADGGAAIDSTGLASAGLSRVGGASSRSVLVRGPGGTLALPAPTAWIIAAMRLLP